MCFLISLLAACDTGSQPRLDRATFEEETRRREPRRIKEAEIMGEALEQGTQIINELKSKAVADSLQCCPSLPRSLQDSLERQYQLRIRCFSLHEQPAVADPLERELLDAYRYNLEQGLPLTDNVQAQGKDFFLYTAPAINPKATANPCAVWSLQLSRKQLVLSL